MIFILTVCKTEFSLASHRVKIDLVLYKINLFIIYLSNIREVQVECKCIASSTESQLFCIYVTEVTP